MNNKSVLDILKAFLVGKIVDNSSFEYHEDINDKKIKPSKIEDIEIETNDDGVAKVFFTLESGEEVEIYPNEEITFK